MSGERIKRYIYDDCLGAHYEEEMYPEDDHSRKWCDSRVAQALESQLAKVKEERDRAVRLLEKLVHPKLLCETNLYNLVSEAEELLSSLTENKS